MVCCEEERYVEHGFVLLNQSLHLLDLEWSLFDQVGNIRRPSQGTCV